MEEKPLDYKDEGPLALKFAAGFVILVILCVLCAGCTSHELCAKGVEAYTDAILPEYLQLVDESPKFIDNEKGKKYRKDSVDGLRRFLKLLKEK